MRTCIHNVTICDGSGAPAYAGSLVFDESGILAVSMGGEIFPADQVINGQGQTVTPGFIDIHRHCDVRPFSGTAYGETMLRQGITTTVVGNCGISPTPAPRDPEVRRSMYDYYEPVLGPLADGLPTDYPSYLTALENASLPVNTAAMIGTGAVRIAVKGFSDTPFSRDEIQRAKGLIEEAMQEGAPGVSLGIMYLPECYGSAEEFAEILEPVGRFGRVITTHIRGEGDSLVQSVQEVIDIARKAGCALEISHFKSCGMKNWGREIYAAIEKIEQARAAGMDVTCDFYPYEGGSTALTTMVPPAFVGGDLKAALARLGTEEGVRAFRDAASREWPGWDNYAISLGWDRILISGVICEAYRPMLGMHMQQAAETFGYPDAVSLAAEMMHREQGKTAIINLSMDPRDIDAVAGLPYSLLISDSIYADTDTPHPRMHGAFPRFLRDFVRERHVLSFEEAVAKMTRMPAQRMGFADRGLLKPGFASDILLFDPANFTDRADYASPGLQAQGMSRAFVGGKEAVRDGKVCLRDGGRLLRAKK